MVKILCVDDCEIVRDGLIGLLSSYGHTVVCAKNGSDALAALDEGIGMVITDYDMPELNGYELTRALRADPRYSGLPIVGLGKFPADEREFLTECFSKLDPIDRILECIHKYCE
ncbi:response regulator [Candidatus Woesearchaeota archaeon]|nr:response regulator [Candidatus Woesearchaeota archaeon]